MEGLIGENGEVFFPIAIQDKYGDYHSINALLDTGFTGYLTLIPELIDALSLIFDKETTVVVGDGTTQIFRQYVGQVIWTGRIIPIRVYAVSGIPVVGLKLLQGGELHAAFVEGGTATFDWLPT